MLGSQEKNLGKKVNVKFFRVDPYRLGNRIPQAFQNLSDLHIRCHREKSYIGFLSQIFYGSQFGAKSEWNLFQGRPSQKNPKT